MGSDLDRNEFRKYSVAKKFLADSFQGRSIPGLYIFPAQLRAFNLPVSSFLDIFILVDAVPGQDCVLFFIHDDIVELPGAPGGSIADQLYLRGETLVDGDCGS